MTQLLDEIKNKRIARLCHFTKSSKLLHILQKEDGIIANTFLDGQIEILTKNDSSRLDGKEDYICCSIQYPNTWYLNKIKNNDALFKEWVILFIDPILLTNPETLFCHRNAASARGANIKRGYEGFSGMFRNTVQGQRLMNRTPQMLSCCPTDDQAEVLIYKNIPRSCIKAIAVPDHKQAQREFTRLSIINAPNIDIIVAPELFNNSWSPKIRRGQIPGELLYQKE
ncbi:DarT ssDNA thymidine ADP-ribosyltransferase family protein [Priestia aryabhattai]|uniref:DarT ssDNA thymidine ADP-ribosyltransferase family protein n=1 Tax=Priestia aryabhattai TaxID=412384 RepID=UPI002453140A|nr:DarT ssDNA thymidine ADP-ribosyltransferase family protein [Priestia aryabhattai]MDH3111317.1 DarT ssDNA thymidine ADP-ribosyltransferase family protein [Priestia aryabhattai]MDH3129859.1 DarT ssDNA thymidine ADP-ribosyltransferase family protein [Priestia aryabhattai]